MHGSFLNEVWTLLHGDIVRVSPASVTTFRLLFALSLFLKHGVELTRKYPSHVARDSFVYFAYVSHDRLRRYLHIIYFYGFWLRPLFLLALIFGFQPRAAAGLLGATLVAELFMMFRYHAMIATILTIVICVDDSFHLRPTYSNLTNYASTVESSGVPFIKLLIVVAYLSSAWRKVQHHFYDGVVLTEAARFSSRAKGRRFPDHFCSLTKLIAEHVIQRFAVPLSYATILVEVAIAILLLCSTTPGQYVGCAIGVLLHIGITFLFPITFGFFTLMMWSTYCLWLL